MLQEIKDWLWHKRGDLLQRAYDELRNELDEEIKQHESRIIALEIKKNKTEIQYHVKMLDVATKDNEIEQYTTEQIKLWNQIQNKEELIEDLKSFYKGELKERVKPPTNEEISERKKILNEKIQKLLQENDVSL